MTKKKDPDFYLDANQMVGSDGTFAFMLVAYGFDDEAKAEEIGMRLYKMFCEAAASMGLTVEDQVRPPEAPPMMN